MPNKTTKREKRVNLMDPRLSDEEVTKICNEQYAITIDEEFAAKLVEAIIAINKGIYPELISQGSSGSYLVKNLNKDKIAVFKPKDEEPYGSLNPKWMKWLQKMCSPCCFGRSCLVQNQGYLAEAGASLVDKKLGLNIVPKTAVVSLAAPTFNYSRVHRALARTKERISYRYTRPSKDIRHVGLPKKHGSFQLYVNNYNDSGYWLEKWELSPEMAPPQFQLEFEKLVILDYLIRNTDRGNDNWLIKYEPANLEGKVDDQSDISLILIPRAKIAAIDNGLAFPFKHPDECRAYPYQWVSLSIAQRPFSDEIINKILPLVDNTDFVRELGNDLRKIFESDKGFDKKIFAKQLSVIRGQMFNLREALRTRKSPAQLVQMTPQYMIEVKKKKRRKFRKFVKNIKNKSSQITSTTEVGSSTTNAEQLSSGKILSEQPHIQDNVPGTSSNVPIQEAAIAAEAMTTTEDELENPKSWHNTFQQKVQTRSPFFAMW